MCVNGWESEDPFSVNSYESEYPKNDESGNIYESGKISSSVNLVLESLHFISAFLLRRLSNIMPIYFQYNFIIISSFSHGT